MRDLYLGRPPVVDVSGLDAARFAEPGPPTRAQHRLAARARTHRGAHMSNDTMRQIPSSRGPAPARPRHRPSLRRRRRTPCAGDGRRRLAGQRRAPGLPRAGSTAAAVDDAVDARPGRLPAVARGARPGRGAPGQAARRAAGRAQGRPRHPDQPRGRQDHLRGARRGAGDDRHLRLRGRPVPPALRPHDALRAPGPPADGDLAPARRRRRHQRLQLPRRGLVVEHRRRPGLRRPRRSGSRRSWRR